MTHSNTTHRFIRWFSRAAVLQLSIASLPAPLAAQAAPFAVDETTIADIHSALLRKTTSCRAIVGAYLARIDAYDKRGPGVNAIIRTHPAALAVADSLDRRFAREGLVGPLHCVPVIVKDNFATFDLPTTAGSLALATWQPTRDAHMVARIREAGGLVLAKSNMAELAFSPVETVSSILPGYTHNPYSLNRVTAGSSGGTAAAVASSFGAVGLGTDTGNSIRGPSAHQALVGMRSTMGLTSRAGVVPLFDSQDIAGPMTRTVADNARVFQVIVGFDADDPVTEAARSQTIPRYLDSLSATGLRGARLGVLPVAYESATLDTGVTRVFEIALRDLTRAGANVVRGVIIPGLDSIRQLQRGSCSPFKYDYARFMAGQAESNPPATTIDAILKSRQYHPSIQQRLESSNAATEAPDASPGCAAREQSRAALRTAVLQAMNAQQLDALVYPTWSNPPRLIGDLNTPAGDNSQLFSPSTGFPAITVPMGYTLDVLPAGLQMLGRPWSEGTLYRLAFAYEQATKHRRPPASTPPLRRRASSTR